MLKKYLLQNRTQMLIIGVLMISIFANAQLINPALPGDNPDPSVIRVGNIYYATSTTNEWAPYFTIYKSTDLKNWTLINHVFPNGYKDMKDEWGGK